MLCGSGMGIMSVKLKLHFITAPPREFSVYQLDDREFQRKYKQFISNSLMDHRTTKFSKVFEEPA